MPKVVLDHEKEKRIQEQAELIAKNYAPYMSPLVASKASGMGRTTIYDAIKEGTLKCKITGLDGHRGKKLVSAYNLAAWIENMREK